MASVYVLFGGINWTMKREKYIPSVSSVVIFISISNKQTFNDIRTGGATSKVVGRKTLLVNNVRDRLHSKFENKSYFAGFSKKYSEPLNE